MGTPTSRRSQAEARKPDGRALDGVLVVDKPAGMTSAQVVAQVKRLLRPKRVGHTGTLDPMATGVLPLCLGEGTKIAQYLLAEDKTYEAELMLGVETDTLDADGQVTARRPEAAQAVSAEALEQTVARFRGPGQQVPPMYSALKHQGRRLHELARAGKTVDRPPRPIVIHTLQIQWFRPPHVGIVVHCSKGTYIRTLADDIGQALSCGAHLTGLRRTSAGAFTLSAAQPLDGLSTEVAAGALISPAQALAHLPAIVLSPALGQAVIAGKPLRGVDFMDDAVAGPDFLSLIHRLRQLAGESASEQIVRLLEMGEPEAGSQQGRHSGAPQRDGDLRARGGQAAPCLRALVTFAPDHGRDGLEDAAARASGEANENHPAAARSMRMRYRRVFTYGLTKTARSSTVTSSERRGKIRPSSAPSS